MTVSEERKHELARTLSTVAQDLQAQASVSETLSSMTKSAVDTIPGADFAGITMVEGRRTVSAQAYTHDTARLCDELQDRLRDGPCWDAVWQQHTVVVPDMSVETRWPRFANEAHRLGIGSMISFQLFVQGENLGALNMHGTAPYAFASDAQLIGELFASHAAVALAGASETRQLNTALATRDTIGQAKGILMCREGVDSTTAFTMLVQASQQSNIKLSEVAAWMVNDHERPGHARRPTSSEDR